MLTIKIENNFLKKPQAIKNAVIEICNDVKERAQYNLDKMIYDYPESKYYKRTHNLWDRLETNFDDINRYKATVGDPMFYAIYNEYGTSKMAPRPFLRTAALSVSKRVPYIVKKWLEVYK